MDADVKEGGKQVGFRLKADLFAKVAAAANARGVKVGQYVRDLVVASLDDGATTTSTTPAATLAVQRADDALSAQLERLVTLATRLERVARPGLLSLLVAAGKTEPEDATAFCDELFADP